MTHWVTRHNQIHSGRTWTYLAILQFRVFLLREERLSETNGWIMVVPMEFSSTPLWFFSAYDPSLGWDLYNHLEHQLWFWAATGHFQPYYPGLPHWAWLIVDAPEVLLTDSCCLCLESCSLISSPCPLPLSQTWLRWYLLQDLPPCCWSSLSIQTPPYREWKLCEFFWVKELIAFCCGCCWTQQPQNMLCFPFSVCH